MKNEKGQNRMIWAIVILAVMNISTLATIFYHQYQSNRQVPVSAPGQQQLETDSEKFSGKYFRDKLNLRNDQMEKFRLVNQSFRRQARAITTELSVKRKSMLDAMASQNPDTIRLNALSDSIGSLHSTLKKITYNYYLNLKEMCSTEQQKQLEQLFREMFINDSAMGFPGGKHWRGGRGKNTN